MQDADQNIEPIRNISRDLQASEVIAWLKQLQSFGGAVNWEGVYGHKCRFEVSVVHTSPSKGNLCSEHQANLAVFCSQLKTLGKQAVKKSRVKKGSQRKQKGRKDGRKEGRKGRAAWGEERARA